MDAPVLLMGSSASNVAIVLLSGRGSMVGFALLAGFF